MIPLLQCLLVRRSISHGLQVPQDVGIRAQVHHRGEPPHRGQREDGHYVGRAQVLPGEELVGREPVVQELQRRLVPLGEDLDDGGVFCHAGEQERHEPGNGRLQGAVGEVQPLQVVTIFLVVGRPDEPRHAASGDGVAAVYCQDVVHDCAGLGQAHGWRDGGILEVRRRAEGVDVLQVLGRKGTLGVSLVDMQCVRNFELLVAVSRCIRTERFREYDEPPRATRLSLTERGADGVVPETLRQRVSLLKSSCLQNLLDPIYLEGFDLSIERLMIQERA